MSTGERERESVCMCECLHAQAAQRQLKANSGILSGSKRDAMGRQWRQPRCVLWLFMWNHLKVNKRTPPIPSPTPPPLHISQYKAKKWMKEGARGGRGDEVRGCGCKGGAAWMERGGCCVWGTFSAVFWDNDGPKMLLVMGFIKQSRAGKNCSP